jgi:hypothetical protein
MTLEIRDQLEYDRLKRLSTWISAVRVVPYAWNLVRTDLWANAWGWAKMTFDYSLFHWMWTTEIPFRIWRTYENWVEIIAYSSVNIISLNWTAVIKSGATAWNYSVMQSRNSPRYQPNRWHLYSTALMLPDKQNGVRWWGLWVMNWWSAPYMWIFFKLSWWKLYASLYNLWVEFKTEEITLPDDMQDIDLEKWELFDIQFQWRWVWDFFFFINLRLVHTIKNLWTLDYVSIANPALPSMYLSENVDWTEVEIRVWCVNIDSEWWQNEWLTYTWIVNADDVSVSSKSPPVALLVVYNKLIHKTGINRRDVRLLRMILWTDNASRFQFLRTEDASAFTWLSLIDRYDDSVLQYHDVSLSWAVVVDINKCDTITRWPVSNLMPFVLWNPSDKIDFIINPWDYLIIMGEKKAINALMSATLEFWESI